MGLKQLTGLAVLILLLPAGGPAKSKKSPEHLLIQVVYQAGEFKAVKTVRMGMEIPNRRNPKRTWPWRVVVKSKKGVELYRVGLADPTVLRGEFADPADPQKIIGHHLRHTGPVSFTVRVPVLPDTRIEFYSLSDDLRRTPNPPDEAYRLIGSLGEWPR